MHVALQTSVGGKCVATKFTVFQSGLGMFYRLVILHGLFGSECFLTVAAHEGSLTGVEPHMIHEIEILSEGLAAVVTDMLRLGEVVCSVSPHFWSRH